MKTEKTVYMVNPSNKKYIPAKNKELLSKRMLELRQEIKTPRNNPYASKGRQSFAE